MLSESSKYKPMNELLQTLKYNGGKETEYYKNSLSMDNIYRKSGNYWSNDDEILARAFAVYISDKLPDKSDYLVGHAKTAIGIDNES